MSQEVSMRGNRRSYPRRILLIIGGVLWMLQGLPGIVRRRSLGGDMWSGRYVLRTTKQALAS